MNFLPYFNFFRKEKKDQFFRDGEMIFCYHYVKNTFPIPPSPSCHKRGARGDDPYSQEATLPKAILRKQTKLGGKV